MLEDESKLNFKYKLTLSSLISNANVIKLMNKVKMSGKKNYVVLCLRISKSNIPVATETLSDWIFPLIGM